MIQDKIHIGSLIKNKLKENGHSVKWFSNKICCQRRNIYDIFCRPSIDTLLLLKIGFVLKTNFFEYFSDIHKDTMSEKE